MKIDFISFGGCPCEIGKQIDLGYFEILKKTKFKLPIQDLKLENSKCKFLDWNFSIFIPQTLWSIGSTQ